MKIEIDFKQLEDSLKRQVPYIQKEAQALLENLHEELGNWLKRTEVDECVTPINPNQERKDFIEDAKRFWEEHGKDYMLVTRRFVEHGKNKFERFIGCKNPNTPSSEVTFNSSKLCSPPESYCTNKHLFKAYLLAEYLGKNKYRGVTPPLPNDLEVKGVFACDNGKLIDDTEAEY